MIIPALLSCFVVSAQYCVSGGPSTIDDSNVESVTLTGETMSISYTGCAPAVTGVEDQTAQVADLKTGFAYSVSVVFGTCGATASGTGQVWIDWNNDSIFQGSETIGNSSGTPGTFPWDTAVDFDFIVPVGASLGSTRMRVIQYEAGVLPINPCGAFTNGSVTDFTIDLSFGTSCAPVSGINYTSSGIDSVTIGWTAGGSEMAWNVELGLSGFIPGTGSAVYSGNTTTNTDTIYGLTGSTTYDVYVQADCGADSSSWEGPQTVITDPSCPSPSLLAATTLSADSVALDWTPGSSETEWLIEYDTSGFTYGTGILQTTSGGPVDTLSGLSGGTTYQAYLQAVCGVGDSSIVIGPISFTTNASNDDPCGAIALPVDGVERLFSNDLVTASSAESSLTMPAGTGSGGSCVSDDGWCSFELTVSRAMWFTFVAPTSGHVQINCTGTNYDGQIAVFDSTDCTNLSSFVLLNANDDDPDGSGSFAPNLTICGLVPGNTYYLMHDEYAGTGAGVVSFNLSEVPISAGSDGTLEVCETDTVNLFGGIGSPASGGVFSFPDNPVAIVNDTLFDATIVPDGNHQVLYIVSNTCATDTAIATVNVQEQASSGTPITPFNVCNTEIASLWNGLTGEVDFGGLWSDDTGTGLLSGSNFDATGAPVGTYQFTYSVSTGVCPMASTTIDVIVDDCVGISEFGAPEIHVYPNPGNGIFTISNLTASSEVLIKIHDINGKLVHSETAVSGQSGLYEVRTDLEAGVYFLCVHNGHHNLVLKLQVNQ